MIDNTITYREMKNIFKVFEATNPRTHLIGYITFTEDSFDKHYDEVERTYVVSSYNKAFRPNMNSSSIFGSSLDGKDLNVRLDSYMEDEYGGEDGWRVECCSLQQPVDQDFKPTFLGQIIDIFEDFLEEHNIQIDNPEKADDGVKNDESTAIIYGSDYGKLQEKLTDMMVNWHIMFPDTYDNR